MCSSEERKSLYSIVRRSLTPILLQNGSFFPGHHIIHIDCYDMSSIVLCSLLDLCQTILPNALQGKCIITDENMSKMKLSIYQ